MLTHDPDDRLAIARRVYAIVVAFAFAFADPGTPDDEVAERLSGWSAAETEAAVRLLATEAEMNSRAWNGRDSQIVMGALDAESLADDYLRMKSGEQWMAFEDAPEQDGESLRPASRDHCTATETHWHAWSGEHADRCSACGGEMDGFAFVPAEMVDAR